MTQQTSEQIEIERLRGLLDYATDTDAYRRLRALNEGLRLEIAELKESYAALMKYAIASDDENDNLKELAIANGFESITDAITQAHKARDKTEYIQTALDLLREIDPVYTFTVTEAMLTHDSKRISVAIKALETALGLARS